MEEEPPQSLQTTIATIKRKKLRVIHSGGDGGDPPHEGVVPPHGELSPPSEKLLVPPQEDIGPPPLPKIFGALRAHSSYFIGNCALFPHKVSVYRKK